MKVLLLLGGGHAHLQVLSSLAQRRLAGCEVVLVTPSERHTYSGMLPGFIAGHYALEEIQIDLAPLCERAGARLVLDSAAGLDPVAREVRLAGSPALRYDVLSIDVGAAVGMSVPGSPEHALPVRPLEPFLERIDIVGSGHRVAVVGAGAAGVELAMALRVRGAEVALFSERVEFPAAAWRRLERALARSGVELRAATPVVAVEAGPVVVTRAGREAFEVAVWATGPAPMPWWRESGLAVDGRGFIRINDTLRSVSHPEVFAAGDCASLHEAPEARSGVHAVRQGPVLSANLASALRGGSLKRYGPRKRALYLISCGGRSAVAARGALSAEGEWVWRWKERIDRRWLARFR